MTVLNKIIESSEKLFMTYGLKSISMDDIATDIGCSKKTIYKHFNTKERLINFTLNQFLKREKKIINEIHADSENAVDEIIKIDLHIIKMTRKLKPCLLFDLKKYHSKNWSIIEKYQHEFIQEVIKNNLKRGIEEKYFRSSLDPDLISRLYVAKSLYISNDQNFNVQNINLNNVFKEHLLYHLYGVLSEEGIKLVTKYELENI